MASALIKLAPTPFCRRDTPELRIGLYAAQSGGDNGGLIVARLILRFIIYLIAHAPCHVLCEPSARWRDHKRRRAEGSLLTATIADGFHRLFLVALYDSYSCITVNR